MKLPSVTKILDATMDPQKRASLEAWKDRVGHEEAERIRQAAMRRGNVIDEQVLLFKDTGACDDDRIANYLAGYGFVAHELSVVSTMHRYQGRLDAVLQFNGRNILVDFKGSSRWKPSKYLEDYGLQLGAYFGACLETGYNIDAGCVVLFVDGKPTPQLHWLKTEELHNSHAVFVKKVAQYYYHMNEPQDHNQDLADDLRP